MIIESRQLASIYYYYRIIVIIIIIFIIIIMICLSSHSKTDFKKLVPNVQLSI